VEGRLTLVQADFVAAADSIPGADVVAMDRVVCCYPAVTPLVEAALASSRRALALSYPRDAWHVRVVIRLQNLARATLGNPFRTFVHPAATLARLIERHGFRRVSRTGTFVWVVDVYVRDTPRATEDGGGVTRRRSSYRGGKFCGAAPRPEGP
jgi:hypothetical protein